MPRSYILDASVMAKWFNNGESNEGEALSLRDQWGENKLILQSPSLIVFEVANAIWKNPKVESSRAATLARLVLRLAPNLVEPDEQTSEDAMALARKSRMTFYDCVYVALSKSLNSPLISADSDQLKIAKDYTNSFHINEVSKIL